MKSIKGKKLQRTLAAALGGHAVAHRGLHR